MRTFFLLLFLFPAMLYAYERGGFNSIQPKYAKDGKRVDLFDGKRYLGLMIPDQNKDISLVRFAVKDGSMVVDTREYHKKNPGRRLIFNTAQFPRSEIKGGERALLRVQVSADPAGPGIAFELVGQRTASAGKTHYWNKPVPFLTDELLREKKVSRILPNDLTSLGGLFYFTSPAVYRIGKLSLTYPGNLVDDGKTLVLPKGNRILNGGAEHGLYQVFTPDVRRMGTSIDGKYHDYFGTVMTKCTEVSQDDKVVRSGKYSFRLDRHSKSLIDRIGFNQVPYYPGHPVAFSVWMKAEKKIRVELWLHPCSGSRYSKSFLVGPEWKKYTLSVPSYGKAAKGIAMSGNPAMYASGNATMTPAVLISAPGRVWVDDVRCEYALNTSDEGDRPAVRMTGSQERSFVHAGEKIKVGLLLESAGKVKSGMLSWKLVDLFGKTILEQTEKNVVFPFRKTFELLPPENRRGPMNLSFDLTLPDGTKQTCRFLTGVIGAEKPLHPAFGVNVELSERHNAELAAKMLKAFRIGAVRIWRNGVFKKPELDSAKIYHKNGFYTLYCLSYTYGPGKRFFLPVDPSEYLKNLENLVTNHTRGFVDAYEIFNEPNAWGGQQKNPDPKVYLLPEMKNVLDMTRKIHGVLKKYDPEAKIAGPATCHTMVPWIQAYLDGGAAELIDIISEHPYRHTPELPDYADDLRAIRAMGKPFGKNFPIYSTESGGVIPMNPEGNRIPARAVRLAANDLRLALIGFAGGLDKYFHFQSGIALPSNEFSDFMISDVTRDFGGWIPSPYLYAFRAAADLLEQATFSRQVRIGMESRCYIFDRGDKRIAVLWKWNGTPGLIYFPEAFDYYDFVGSKFRGDHFELSEHPVFLETSKSVDDLERTIRNARIPVSGNVCSVSGMVSGPKEYCVIVRNLTAEPLSGVLEIRSPVRLRVPFDRIPAEQTFRHPVRLPETVSMNPQHIVAEVHIPGRPVLKEDLKVKGILVPKKTGKIVADGDLSDWKGASSVSIDFRNAVSSVKLPWSEAEKKIRAELKFLWNMDGLYLAVVVYKDKLQPEERFGEMAFWQGDSLQIAFDTVRNADENTKGYQDDDFEYAVAFYKNAPFVYRAHASSASYDSLPKSIGKIHEVPVAVRHQPGKTVYEMVFPRFSISPFKLEPNSASGFNLILNIGNGQERRGWLELAPGIGQNPKQPGLFTELILLP